MEVYFKTKHNWLAVLKLLDENLWKKRDHVLPALL
jgi:hypothetical protein